MTEQQYPSIRVFVRPLNPGVWLTLIEASWEPGVWTRVSHDVVRANVITVRPSHV